MYPVICICIRRIQWGGNNNHSCLDALQPFPIFISSPKRVKCGYISNITFVSCYWSSKVNAPSSTYSTHNISRNVTYKKVLRLWSANLPISNDEYICCFNVTIINPALTYFFYNVSEKTITMNRNNTGTIQSPCLTLTVWTIYFSALSIFRITLRPSYIIAMAERNFGSPPYSSKILIISWWLTLSNNLTRYTKCHITG